MDVIIDHDPQCGSSCKTPGLIRNAGIEPRITEYLKSPPTRLLLRHLVEGIGAGVRLCRPSEAVLDILPPQQGKFRKEDGELAMDASGCRAGTA
ncbi:MAG TPA: hypothetical protein VFF61_10720 [Microvirga sp.]|nr:hypothetical protein [Microvirga sp.]